MIEVSVVIPCFNAGSTLRRAVLSALAQGVDVEVIVVDDCSTDDSLDVGSQLQREFSRVRFIRNEINLGPGASRNRALAVAQGEYVAFLDADDVWMPQKLKNQLSFMRRSRLRFSYHDYYRVDLDGDRPVASSIVRSPASADLPSYCYTRGYGMCLTSVVERLALNGIFFPEDRSINTEDYFFFLALLASGVTGARCPGILGAYTVSLGNRSSNKLKQATSVFRSNSIILKRDRLTLALYFLRYVVSQILVRLDFKRQKRSKVLHADVGAALGLGPLERCDV